MNAPISSAALSLKDPRRRSSLAFSLDPRLALAQGRAQPAGQPQQQPHARCLAAHQRRRHGRPSSPARSSSARASSPRSRRSRPTSSTCALERIRWSRATPARTPNEGKTAGSQSVQNSGIAVRFAGAEVRAMLLELAAQETRRRSRYAEGGRRHHQRARRPQGRLLEARRRARPQARSDRQAQAEAAGRASDRRQERSRATTFRRSSPAARPTCRTSACPACCSAAWCGRRARARSSTSVDEAAVETHAGRGRRGARRHFLARRRRARGAGDQGARRACARAREWKDGAAAASGAAALRASADAAARDAGDRRQDRRRRRAGGDDDRGDATRGRTSCTARSARRARWPSCSDGKLTVWTHSQGVYPLRATSPRRSACGRRSIRCIHAEGAGCYGHNGADDVALDAALLARATRPAGASCSGCATTSSRGSPTARRW